MASFKANHRRKVLFLVFKENGKLCAMITTPSFKSLFALPHRILPSYVKSTPFPLSPIQDFASTPVFLSFVLPFPKPAVWSRQDCGSLALCLRHLWKGRKQGTEKLTHQFQMRQHSLKKGLLRGLVSFFSLSVLCKDLLRREKKFSCFFQQSFLIAFPFCRLP